MIHALVCLWANTISNLFLVEYLNKTPISLTDVEQLQIPVKPEEIVVLRRKVDTGMGENDPVRKVMTATVLTMKQIFLYII